MKKWLAALMITLFSIPVFANNNGPVVIIIKNVSNEINFFYGFKPEESNGQVIKNAITIINWSKIKNFNLTQASISYDSFSNKNNDHSCWPLDTSKFMDAHTVAITVDRANDWNDNNIHCTITANKN